MFWIIASIPFWLIGAFCMVAAVAAVTRRTPDETSTSIGVQMLMGLVLSGVFLVIAAKVAGA
jgi:hypothetical protein